jgi:hypothetical protein
MKNLMTVGYQKPVPWTFLQLIRNVLVLVNNIRLRKMSARTNNEKQTNKHNTLEIDKYRIPKESPTRQN